MIQHFRDWLHERYIRRTADRCTRCVKNGDRTLYWIYWGLMVKAIRERSDDQVRRMERQRGLR